MKITESKLMSVGIIKITFVCLVLISGLIFPSFSQPECSRNVLGGGDYDLPPAAPGAFDILTETNWNSTTVDLTWSSSTGAYFYEGFFSTSPGSLASPGTLGCVVGSNTTPATTTNCTLTGLLPNTTYYIVLEASSVCYESLYPSHAPTGYYQTKQTMATYSNDFPILTLPGVPSPSAGSSSSQNQITANWLTPPGGANSYTVQLASNTGFTSDVQTSAPVIGPSKAFTGLVPNTNYYYHVLATNGTGSTLYSSGYATVPTLPSAPTVLTASGINQTQFNANWNALSGNASVTYTVDLATDNAFTSIVRSVSSVTGTSTTFTGLSSNTNYYYRVRATNASGSSSYSSSSPTVLTLPDAGTPSAASQVGQNQFQANWNAPPGYGALTSYVAQIATNSIFTTGLQTSAPVSGTSTIFTGLSSNTNYYYRVMATNATGPSPSYSTTYTTVVTVPDAGTPTSASQVGPNQFTANWNAPPGNGVITSYTVQIATNSTFTIGLQTSPPVSGTSTPFTGLSSNTNYYYRVLASNATGPSPSYSSTYITVLTLAGPPTPSTATGISQTQFNANWSAPSGGTAAALTYAIQLSDNNAFPSGSTQTIPAGSSTSALITSLNSASLKPNTYYYYRVSADNGSGSPQYSSTFTTVLTFPDAPALASGSGIDQTQFTANWSAPSGSGVLTSYTVQFSLDNTFPSGSTQTIPNVIGTSKVITNLNPGNRYYYRASATNVSGTSSYSPPISVLTSPETPINVSPVTPFPVRQVKISWPSVATATSYDVQFKKNSETSWTDVCKGTSSTDCSVSDLLSATFYDFRVRASNGTTSPYSTVFSTVTSPDRPDYDQLNPPIVTSATASLSWKQVLGADHYKLEVATNEAFTATSILPGYPKTISGKTDQVIGGLSPLTIYYFRVSACNASGDSEYSTGKGFFTTDASGGTGNLDLTIVSTSYPIPFDGPNNIISLNVTGYFYPLTATLFYRKITDPNYTSVTNTINGATKQTQSGSTYWTIDSSMLDEMGLEFYIKVSDSFDQSKTSPAAPNTTYRIHQKNEVAITPASFGTSVKDYTMISVPYDDLNGITIESILEQMPDLGTYDPKKWRFVRYQDGKNVDYKQQGLSKSSFSRGKSYWLLTKNKADLNFGSRVSPDNYQGNDFVLQLKEGWNQIASPYPFTIDWNNVMDANKKPKSIGNLKVFDPTIIGFKDYDQLEKFSGGFVHADKDTSIIIPVTSRPTSGGRISKKSDASFTEQGAWFLPITLEHNGIQNSLGAIGMHPRAQTGKDEFDDLTLPRFLNYLEWNSYHSDFVTPKFTRDIVPAQNSFVWNFSMNSSETGVTNITWNQLLGAKGELIMHDLYDNVLVNMGSMNSYSFNGSDRNFKIYYNSEVVNIPGQIQLGVPSPNPAIDQVTIPVVFSDSEFHSIAKLQIFDLRGVLVAELAQSNSGRGIHEVVWDGQNSEGRKVQPGLYFFRVQTSLGSAPPAIFSGKILMY